MINYTIFGQMIAFALFVWFCMMFVWPPLIGAINERQRKIEAGLSAAEQARSELASAEAKAQEQFSDAKEQAARILENAHKTANQMIEDAKTQARLEGERIITQAHASVEQEISKAREHLRAEVAELAVLGAERILQKSIDKHTHADMLNQLAAKL